MLMKKQKKTTDRGGVRQCQKEAQGSVIVCHNIK